MNETLMPLKIPPGVVRAGTPYQSAGRWYDANLVRFFAGTIRPVGGWRRAQDSAGADLAPLAGVPRAMLAWSSDSGDPYLAAATTEKLYLLAGGEQHDITPAGFTPGRRDAGYSTDTGAYSRGPYGSGPYGTGSLQSILLDADTWQLDNFGDYLVAVSTSDEKLYVWRGNPALPAAVPEGAPTSVRAVVATPERFLVALGASGPETDSPNRRRVHWASQETIDDWEPTPTNTAGDFELVTNGRILAGRRTRGQTLIFTDTDVHAMTYIGGPLVYRFDQVGDQCGLIAPNAVAIVDTQAFWMGEESFFVFDGFVKPIPCEVADYVFTDFNAVQKSKAFAVPIAQYGEIWWFYPSAGSNEIDRYVAYNYREGHWSLGKLARSAGAPSGATLYPILCSPTGAVYEHEIADDRVSTRFDPVIANGSVVGDGQTRATGEVTVTVTEAPYLESGPIELGSGDLVMKVGRLIPDEKTLGDVRALFFGAFYPTGPEERHGPYPLTQPTDVRFTARQARVRLEQARETNWRVGTLRVGLRAGGRR